MSHNPWFTAAVTHGALRPVTGPARGEQAGVVPQDGAAPRLVEGDPMLHLGSEGLEDKPCVVCIVLDEFVLVQETSVPFVEFIGDIPVEEGDHRDDPGSVQVIHQFDIVLQALLIDGIISSAQRDDTGPSRLRRFKPESFSICPHDQKESIKRQHRCIDICSYLPR